MARQARIVLPEVAHHVTQRGTNRQDIFLVDDDRRVYISYLKESAARYGLAVSAFCLMTNHVHLIVTPETERSLSKALGRRVRAVPTGRPKGSSDKTKRKPRQDTPTGAQEGH